MRPRSDSRKIGEASSGQISGETIDFRTLDFIADLGDISNIGTIGSLCSGV